MERETRRSFFYSLGILKGLLCVPRLDLLDYKGAGESVTVLALVSGERSEG